ncbi:MAG: transposase, partial [Marmoricola sp.]
MTMTVMTPAAPSGAAHETAPLAPDGGGGEPESPAARLSRELLSDEAIDELLADAGDGQVALTGPGGFLPEMIRRVLERGMAAELTGHLGYDKHERAGGAPVNSRNGSTPKTVATEVGDICIA